MQEFEDHDSVLSRLGSMLGEHTHTLRLRNLYLAAMSRADVQVWCMPALLLLPLAWLAASRERGTHAGSVDQRRRRPAPPEESVPELLWGA
jgi:hypothetical protein